MPEDDLEVYDVNPDQKGYAMIINNLHSDQNLKKQAKKDVFNLTNVFTKVREQKFMLKLWNC